MRLMNKLIKYFCFLGVLIVLGCNDGRNKNSDHVQIEFDGYKLDFYKKYDLILDLKSIDAVSNMLSLFNDSKEIHFCRERPVMWKIKVYNGVKENRDLLFSLNSNTEDEINVFNGSKCFDNPLLIQTLTRLLKVDKIREYNGPLDQTNFMKIITGDSLYNEIRFE